MRSELLPADPELNETPGFSGWWAKTQFSEGAACISIRDIQCCSIRDTPHECGLDCKTRFGRCCAPLRQIPQQNFAGGLLRGFFLKEGIRGGRGVFGGAAAEDQAVRFEEFGEELHWQSIIFSWLRVDAKIETGVVKPPLRGRIEERARRFTRSVKARPPRGSCQN